MYSNLKKVSSYARSIGKSVELIRVWIRSGKWVEGVDYVIIDGVTFVKVNKK